MTSIFGSAQAAPFGRWVWYDLMTRDVPGSIAFYGKLAGWGTSSMDMGPGGMYTMFMNGDAAVGGVNAMGPEMPNVPPHWMGAVGVANVDDAARRAESLGGKVVTAPADIPGIGRWAVIADPQGAILSLYANIDGLPPGDFAPQLGQFSWHELMTPDQPGAMAFYSALFGWEAVGSMAMGADMGGGEYLMYGHAGAGAPPGMTGVPYGGIFAMSPEMTAQMPASWVFYVRVPSADAAADLLTSSGGSVFMPPMEVPGGGERIAQGMDPHGAMIAVHSINR